MNLQIALLVLRRTSGILAILLQSQVRLCFLLDVYFQLFLPLIQLMHRLFEVVLLILVVLMGVVILQPGAAILE